MFHYDNEKYKWMIKQNEKTWRNVKYHKITNLEQGIGPYIYITRNIIKYNYYKCYMYSSKCGLN